MLRAIQSHPTWNPIGYAHQLHIKGGKLRLHLGFLENWTQQSESSEVMILLGRIYRLEFGQGDNLSVSPKDVYFYIHYIHEAEIVHLIDSVLDSHIIK